MRHKKSAPCALCEGTGKITYNEDGKRVIRACGRCNGTGTVS